MSVGQGNRVQRVLFLEHNTDGTVGGSHFCLLDICRALDRKAFEPVIWFYQHNTLIDQFRALGTEVHVQGPLPPLHFAARMRNPLLRKVLQPFQSISNLVRGLFGSASRWKRALRELRIDIVHLNNSVGDDHDLLLAARSLGLPCIAHQRGFPRPLTALDQRLAKKFSAVLAISSSVREDLFRKGIDPRAVTLVFDGIAADRVVPQRSAVEVRRELNIPEGARVIGIVGNVKPWKGQQVLVRAMRAVLDAHPDTHCLVVGAIVDAAYKQRLDADIASSGVADRVHFLGYRQRPIEYTAAMEIAVHASVEPEPFGIVILEAMALRKPVIASAVGGPLDIVVDGETGFLTPAGDSAALASRIVELLSDPARAVKFGENGHRRFSDLFTAERNARQLESIYRAAQGPRR